MNRRYCLVFGLLALASCSSNNVTVPGAAGASASAGSSGSPADGSSGASNNVGGAGLGSSAQAGNASNAGASNAGASNAGASNAGASNAGASNAGAGGSPAGAGTSGASSGAAGNGGASGRAGSGGAGGNAGAGGAPVKYCDTHPLVEGPVIVTKAFDLDEMGTDLNEQLQELVLSDACDDPAEMNAVGSCTEWKYTPTAAGGTLKLAYVSDPAGSNYAPVCMAPGMKVTFAAKGALGGEKVTFGASQATPIEVTLTNAWKQYTISLSGVNYNTDLQGVQPAFFWSVNPTQNEAGGIRFVLDDIKYVKE